MVQKRNTGREVIDVARARSASEIAQLQNIYGEDVTIIRYLTTAGQWKRLTPREARDIVNAGANLGLVYQDGGTGIREFQGNGGTTDGRAALDQVRALGVNVPPGTTIYFAVDYDAPAGDIAQINEYFRQVRAVLEPAGYRVGVYGSGAVCSAVQEAGHADMTWLAGAMGWRGSRDYERSGRWNMRQHIPADGGPDTNTVNPLVNDIGDFGSVTGEYNRALDPDPTDGVVPAAPDPRTAGPRSSRWMDRRGDGQDEDRDRVLRQAESLGLDAASLRRLLGEGGITSMLIMIMMAFVLGPERMLEIANDASLGPEAPPVTIDGALQTFITANPQLFAWLETDGQAGLSTEELRALNMNGDGVVNVQDVRLKLTQAGITMPEAATLDALQPPAQLEELRDELQTFAAQPRPATPAR